MKKVIVLILVLVVITAGALLLRDIEGEDFGEPYITGEIFNVENGQVLIGEGLEGEIYDGDYQSLEGTAIRFTIDDETKLLKNGEEIEKGDLEVGQKASGWPRGVVMESYPEQAEAAKIKVITEEDLRTYESEEINISLEIPEEASTDYEQDRLKVTYVGEDSHMTEITDGFTFFVDVLEPKTDLESLAEKEYEERTEVLEPISEPTRTTYGGRPVYEFKVESGLGGEQVFHVFERDDRTVITSQFIADPEERGYEEMVESIFKSIEVNEEIEELACQVSGCSGEVCDEDVVETTCEHLPGAECLPREDCKAVNDECEWVLSEEAADCLLSVEEEQGPGVRDSRIGHLFEKAEEVNR